MEDRQSLRIVGAGLGRTGTMSLKVALEQLLGAPCYHMAELFTHPGHIAPWHAAAREEEIASRIEGPYAGAVATQRELLIANPDLLEVNTRLFAGLTLEQQFEIQAQGERLGAATWRAFAERATDTRAQDLFRGCAPLEEESAVFLERLITRTPS